MTISGKVVSLFPPKKDAKLSRMIARALRILATNRHGRCRWLKESPDTQNRFGSYDFSHKASLYLEGFWQHYRYFDAYRDLLCKEFQLKEEFISEPCRRLIAQEQSEDSVAVHIRRGDYEAAWVLKDDYYHKAFAFMNESLRKKRFAISLRPIKYLEEVLSF